MRLEGAHRTKTYSQKFNFTNGDVWTLTNAGGRPPERPSLAADSTCLDDRYADALGDGPMRAMMKGLSALADFEDKNSVARRQ